MINEPSVGWVFRPDLGSRTQTRGEHAAISLFTCTNVHSTQTSQTWDGTGGYTAVLVAAKAATPPPQTPPAKGMPAQRIGYEAVFEPDPDANDNVDDPPAVGKVGGYPGWLQGDETPDCEHCDRAMRFVAQIPELTETLNFIGGDGYLFCCPDEHAATFLWQH